MAGQRVNEFGQPVGPALPDWTARAAPPAMVMQGHWCRIEPVSVERHAKSLYAAFSAAPDDRDWTYMSAGPFADAAKLGTYLARIATSVDPLHHAIIDARTGEALGIAALMRIDRFNGVIEIGHISYSRQLQRTTAGTEAVFLFMRRVFDELGYRRFEWKCDHLNAPSRAAALRYGFTYEGIFRQAVVYKGRSRDTAWFAITDQQWPRLRDAYQQWLAPGNFDATGRQQRRLAGFIEDTRAG
jgi:RimJ/RimL family protein N-acetyltransferase